MVENLIGRRFGKRVVVERGPNRKNGSTQWWCRCDCGSLSLVRAYALRSGLSKSCGCLTVQKSRGRCGKNHPQWKGGRTKHQGYVVLSGAEYGLKPGKKKYRHTFVMEEILGRRLEKGETVHHKNGIRDDNRPENLELWSSGQPPGQRVSDKILWAIDFLRRYAPEELCNA